MERLQKAACPLLRSILIVMVSFVHSDSRSDLYLLVDCLITQILRKGRQACYHLPACRHFVGPLVVITLPLFKQWSGQNMSHMVLFALDNAIL